MKTTRETQSCAWRLAAVMSLLVVAGCGQRQEPTQGSASSGKPVVICANYPLKYFVERIAGRRVQVEFLVPADLDPAFWEPSSEDIIEMQQADVVLLNGAGYEKWLPTISLPESRLVDTSASFRDRYIHQQNSTTHQHGPSGQHTHGDVAFTTWLDLSLACRQAEAVEAALRRVLPNGNAELHAGLVSLTNELMALDRELQVWGQSLDGQPVLGSHPVYQYFDRRYGLNMKSVHWEPGLMPDEASWHELDLLLKEHPATLMIWEAEPLPAVADKLNERGVACRRLEPCGKRPADGDLLSTLKRNLELLRR